MQSTIAARGQTVIPAEIRRRFQLEPSKKLEWIVDDNGITVVPVKADPIEAFRGQGKGGSVERLLQDRKRDYYSGQFERNTQKGLPNGH